MNFVVYDITTGRILRSGMCVDTDLPLQVLSVGEAVIEGTCNLNTDYVVAGVVTPRPTTGLVAVSRAVNADLVITPLPIGSVVFVDDVEEDVLTDTTLTISFPVQGVWSLSVETPFPCISGSCLVTVT